METKGRWVQWIDPEVGVPVMECGDCGYFMPTLDPPNRCPQCGQEKKEIMRGRVFDDD